MSKRKESPKLDVLGELSGLAQEETAAPKKQKSSNRKSDRVTYYLDEPIREYVRQLSVKWGVPASQAAKWFLMFAIDAYENGRIPDPPLTPSESPAYRNNIDFKD